MSTSRPQSTPVAIVGVGAILPDAPDAPSFWTNLREGRYSISDVTDRWDADLYYDPDPSAPVAAGVPPARCDLDGRR